MDLPDTHDSIAVAIRLQPDPYGSWSFHVEGTSYFDAIPLAPATLIVRLWRSDDSKILRGTVQLHGSTHTAMLQSNTQLIEIISAWLLGNNRTVSE